MTILSRFKTFFCSRESSSDLSSRSITITTLAESNVNTHLIDMLRIQQRINTRVDPEWVNKEFGYYRALWVECAELLDHIGWKWWKKQESNIGHIKLELIDILHFGLSILLMRYDGDVDSAARNLASCYKVSQRGCDEEAPTILVELVAQEALVTQEFAGVEFFQLTSHYGMSFDEIYSTYVGKSVLNLFRQDNGYKEGTYIKTWDDGKEDNEHLSAIMANTPRAGIGYPEAIEHALANRYALVLQRSKV